MSTNQETHCLNPAATDESNSLWLRRLTLNNFKNIEEAALELSPRLNCLLGNNGMGKSNLVDAVHFLSLCKSFSGAPDKLMIRRGADFAIIRGEFQRRDVDESITIGFAPERRKSVKRGGKEYQRLSMHIGLFPCVLVSAADTDLVTGTSEERRRFVDMAISQSDARYLEALTRYNGALQQRNRLLRDGLTANTALLEAVETVMDMAAAYIIPTRRAFVDRLAQIHRRYYNAIAGEGEQTGLKYSSGAPEGALGNALAQSRERDTWLKHTSVGPHRDDIEFTLDTLPLKRTASQGQQKSFTIALRLAQYQFLAEALNIKPLLLLDDIFDKLDANRVEAIIRLVAAPDFGQIFITDTNRKHLDEIVSMMPGHHALWTVENGVFTSLEA